MTASNGVVQAEYDYDPYGRQTKLSGSMDADFGYTGFYQEKAAGLDLTWFRAYDAEKGRWLSRDPLGEFTGLNLYAYIMNSVLSFVDRYGLADIPVKPQNLLDILPPDSNSAPEFNMSSQTEEATETMLSISAGSFCEVGLNRAGFDLPPVIWPLEIALELEHLYLSVPVAPTETPSVPDSPYPQPLPAPTE